MWESILEFLITLTLSVVFVIAVLLFFGWMLARSNRSLDDR